MVHRWETKEKVKKLRKQGLSYKEIQKLVPIAKSTVSNWCKNITLTPKQKRLLNKKYDTQHKGAQANRLKRKREIKKIRSLAKQEIKKLAQNPFGLAGLMLYWAEGSKTQYVGICNSDPNMIQFMMKWLREIGKVPEYKFKAYLNLHSGQDDKKTKRFWSKITDIPQAQFGKTYIKPEGVGFKKNLLYNGTVKIVVCNKNLLHRILGWIDGYKEHYIEANA